MQGLGIQAEASKRVSNFMGNTRGHLAQPGQGAVPIKTGLGRLQVCLQGVHFRLQLGVAFHQTIDALQECGRQ